MRYTIQKSNWTYLVFFVLVFISRLPFLFSGFGLDANSWGVALAARAFHDRGVYEASRFPGFPLHELLSSLTVSHGYFLTNAMVAFISSLGVLFFVFTLKALRFKYAFLGGAVLAAVPVMYTSSVITYDYALALAFILAGLYFAVKHLPVASGIFLGLAIGFRITSGAMLLPFAIIVTMNDGLAADAKRIMKLLASTVVIGVFAFLPVISQYGFSFFTWEAVPFPGIDVILYKFFIETWGPLGVLALLLGTILLLIPARKFSGKFLFPRSVNEKQVVAWLIAIDLYIIAFLKLPSESGYLLPLVPFVILVFGKYLYSRAFILFSVLILLSPLLVSVTLQDVQDRNAKNIHIAGSTYKLDLLKGPVCSQEESRLEAMTNMDSLFNKLNRFRGISLVVAGKWYNQIQFTKVKQLRNDDIVFVDYINEQSLTRYYDNGYDVYLLPGEAKNNKLKYNYEIGENFDAETLSFR